MDTAIATDSTEYFNDCCSRREGPPAPGNFIGDGWTAFVVDNPDDQPLAWRLAPVALPRDVRDLQLGEAVVRDGDALYVFGTQGRRHEVVVARYAVGDAAAGDLSRPAYCCGGGFREDCMPEAVVSVGMPELSVHRDAMHGDWVMVGSAGYGATTVAWRMAPAPEGPWSDIRDVYLPPESAADGAFVYAGKAHRELAAPRGALVATYVPSTFEPPTVEDEPHTYFPRFVRLERE